MSSAGSSDVPTVSTVEATDDTSASGGGAPRGVSAATRAAMSLSAAASSARSMMQTPSRRTSSPTGPSAALAAPAGTAAMDGGGARSPYAA